jgi:hypothetical protein
VNGRPATRYAPCYSRFAYSTHTAPETPGDPTVAGGSADADPLDNAVVLLDAAGHRLPTARASPVIGWRRAPGVSKVGGVRAATRRVAAVA